MKIFAWILVVLVIIIGGGAAAYFGLIKNNKLSFFAKKSGSSAVTATTIDAKSGVDDKTATLVIGGDIMLARWVEQKALADGGWTSLFDKIRDTLTKPNCAVANLESPFKGQKPQTKINSLIFAAKPEAVDALTDAGIDAVSIANNHITDQGQEGLNETKVALDDKKIIYAGADDSTDKALQAKTLTCGNLKIGFVAATYGTNFPADGVSTANLEGIVQTIKNTRPNVDYLIVYPHWGSEYNATPSPFQIELAHEYIDAGADLVVGSHPHVLQPIEIYKDKTIAYSLGNLVFDQASSGKKTEGALLQIALDDKTQKLTIVPIQIEDYYRPAPADGDLNSYKDSLALKDFSWSLAR